MPAITFIEYDGRARTVEAPVGRTAMQAALDAGVSGILADCGGSCTCATCHAYVDQGWWPKLPPPAASEREMLSAALERREHSRLTCQIRLTPELDGLVLHLPESQL